ncbi:DUF397 domain-containing protein [Streptomyces sp. x-19]|uniref:DUF397 domain-containing protein n=1 Tax=Streptomyces sp. x-19 TaxID=2789280 RepID=UPI00397F4B74
MSGELAWTKSTYSGPQAGDCIEVAADPNTVHVRDSKDKPGPDLTLTPAAWAAFVRYAASAPVRP